ncbi:hypothetical protein PIROE2DRAFT_14676 [Piromyces sp. E2]|nr:hypothetical protein PIROE2DRAFT_14676 [Piromyces sp. E2]|eukprot:OUM59706.1 hypothetical protein PIROE2DRAFT_14676 [Piromyces sp. E2]
MNKTYYLLILVFVILCCSGVKAKDEYLHSVDPTKGTKKVKDKRGVEDLMNLRLNVNVDCNTLVDTIIKESKSLTEIVFHPDGISDTTPSEGGRWISIMADNQIISAYFHPTQRHYARAVGKTDPGRSYADPGVWAVSVAMRNPFGGNKTYYNIVCSCSDRTTSSNTNSKDNETCDCDSNTTTSSNLDEQKQQQEQEQEQDQGQGQVQGQGQGQGQNNNIISDDITDGTEKDIHFSFQKIFIMFTSIIIWQLIQENILYK